MLTSVRIVVLSALLAFLVLGVDPEDMSATVDQPAQQALDAITNASFDPGQPSAAFPRDWALVMGYSPMVAVGPEGHPILMNPRGECSAFGGDTAYGFDAVCKEHDLAYDVLRYSVDVGHPLPAASRHQADSMFRRELHNQCTYRGLQGFSLVDCHIWAESFALAVEVNSWRQGYRPPVPAESLVQWEATLVLFAVLVWARLRIGLLRMDPSLSGLLRPVRRRRSVAPNRRSSLTTPAGR